MSTAGAGSLCAGLQNLVASTQAETLRRRASMAPQSRLALRWCGRACHHDTLATLPADIASALYFQTLRKLSRSWEAVFRQLLLDGFADPDATPQPGLCTPLADDSQAASKALDSDTAQGCLCSTGSQRRGVAETDA